MLEEEGRIGLTNSEIKNGLVNQMQNGITAFFLKWDAEIVGFALINTAQTAYSLKSFYATRNFRSGGVKTLNFKKLAEMLEIDML